MFSGAQGALRTPRPWPLLPFLFVVNRTAHRRVVGARDGCTDLEKCVCVCRGGGGGGGVLGSMHCTRPHLRPAAQPLAARSRSLATHLFVAVFSDAPSHTPLRPLALRRLAKARGITRRAQRTAEAQAGRVGWLLLSAPPPSRCTSNCTRARARPQPRRGAHSAAAGGGSANSVGRSSCVKGRAYAISGSAGSPDVLYVRAMKDT